MSVVTNSVGGAVTQEFDPWGKVRSGGTSATKRNYTGQYLDDTGLLFYTARYYDPALGRFVSADTVVPGNASGGMDGVALKPLTVAFHEAGFATRLAAENQQPFWFQMSEQQQQQAGSPWGPVNPQALNRYSYVQNNPLKYTDPSGHVGITIYNRPYPVIATLHLTHEEATALWNFVNDNLISILGIVTGVLGKLGIDGLTIGAIAAQLGLPVAVVAVITLLASAAFTAAEISLFLGAFALGLFGLDWLYGNNGLDVNILAGVAGFPMIGSPPTVERQSGVWNADSHSAPARMVCNTIKECIDNGYLAIVKEYY